MALRRRPDELPGRQAVSRVAVEFPEPSLAFCYEGSCPAVRRCMDIRPGLSKMRKKQQQPTHTYIYIYIFFKKIYYIRMYVYTRMVFLLAGCVGCVKPSSDSPSMLFVFVP